jgi:CDP-6-deoxy-D-xylo-4-hexulose-3-dehydrase
MTKKDVLRVSYATTKYGKEEIDAVMNVLKDPEKIVAGPRVHEFEEKVAKLFAKKFGIMVNSGSSANLLALEVLNLPRGSEVITPALTFATTLSPIIKLGLVPVFADVEPGKYTVDVDQVEKLISKKTKALMIPLLLGNVPDMKRLQQIAKKHKLYFIEDSCDTLGTRFDGKPTGAYSDASTTSFYASHIITAAGGGGMVMFNNPLLARKALLMANWGRESTLYGAYEKSEEIKKRFTKTIKGRMYDGKFIFSEIGYNFQATEMEAAFGLVQLKNLPKNEKTRKKNFNRLYSFFKQYEKLFILPEWSRKAEINWLAFPLTVRPGAPFTRIDLQVWFEKQNIQTRPIFTGNVLNQPGFDNIKRRTIHGGYPVSDNIMQNGILLGAHHGMEDKHLHRIEESFKEFIKKYD